MAKVNGGILSAFQMHHVGTILTGRSGIVPYNHKGPAVTLQPKSMVRMPLPPKPRIR